MTLYAKWRDVRAKRSWGARLQRLRERRGMSQAQVAAALNVSQPNVSRIERETDIRLSTLDRYVRALGGQVEIQAVFDDETVPLTNPPPE